MTKSEILAAANIDQLYYEKGYFQGMYLDTLGNKFVLPDQYSKKNAQNHAGTIFKEMVEMGVGADRISLSARSSDEVASSEVQIFVK